MESFRQFNKEALQEMKEGLYGVNDEGGIFVLAKGIGWIGWIGCVFLKFFEGLKI